ncbi:MAG: heme-dependent oxidative N-demethylase subunit alpha family protein [Rubrivivax sp.]
MTAHAPTHFDFDAGVQAPFRMQPGLRRLAEGAVQLTPSVVEGMPGRNLREKLQVLSKHASRALLTSPGFDARPALAALAGHAALEQPAAFVWDGDGAAAAPALGWQLRGERLSPLPGPAAAWRDEVGACLNQLAPDWRLAGLLSLAFAEDFAMIDSQARIPWLAVALPSHWSPGDKVGRHFTEVHAPVADNRQLLAAADALARLVCAPARWERSVWSIGAHGSLNAHPDLHRRTWDWANAADAADAVDADCVAAQAWFRSERQTFIPVSQAQQAVFTIFVDTAPLAVALDSAHKARRVHDALASMSPQVLRYRGLHGVRDGLLEWLAQRAAA